MSLDPYLADYAREVVVLATLGAAGLSDYKRRDVDDKVWIAGAVATAPLLRLDTMSSEFMLYLLSLISTLLVCLLILRLKLMGEADAIALAFLAFAEPPSLGSVLTLYPSATVIAVTGLFSLAYAAYNVLLNLRRGVFFEEGVPLASRVAALAAMRLVTIEEYKRKSYMYTPVESLSGPLTLRPLEQHNPPLREKFWVLVGLPYVTLLAAGYAAYLLLVKLPLQLGL